MSAKLKPINVGEVRGDFWVADYQRGYRWSDEVVQLLEDLDSFPVKEEAQYCLQPVVVKRIQKDGNEMLELVDGQQRLTTVFLILKWIAANCIPVAKPQFSITYETREDSKKFLSAIETIPDDYKTKNIDEIFIRGAYRRISSWFSGKDNQLQAAIDIIAKFNKQVKVIWYEPDGEDSVDLFTRLNIGRIRLTNAELVKALFLERDPKRQISEDRQIEIATYWDMFEHELHDERLWCFLTNKTDEDYPTRFELILDLFIEKPDNEKDNFYTFIEFSKRMDSWSEKDAPKKSRELWDDIVSFYEKLKELYAQSKYYHWIGYLIAEQVVSWKDILADECSKTKEAFDDSLVLRVAQSIDTSNKDLYGSPKGYADLSYEDSFDQKVMKRILLLFNVETARRGNDALKRFPFYLYKNRVWSLEHIHAQQSDELKNTEQRIEWLRAHYSSMIRNGVHLATDLEAQLAEAVQSQNVSKELFRTLSDAILALFCVDDASYMHTVYNMALLDRDINAALSNSTFDVKRDIILEKMESGAFVPECTLHVFMKTYSRSSSSVVSCRWEAHDRSAYAKAINAVLGVYFSRTEGNKEGVPNV